MPQLPRDVSLATRVLLAQVLVLAVALVPLGIAAIGHVKEAERRRATDVAEAVSLALATSPWVLAAATGPDPVAELAGPIEALRAATGVDFIVVMAPDGTRYTHPDPTQIGGAFIGSRDDALAGGIVIEDAVGTLGPSVRVVAPVIDDEEVVALVSTGVTLRAVSARVNTALTSLLLVGVAGLAVAVVVAGGVARWMRRRTFGLGAVGLARLHGYHEALLGSVAWGIVLVDNDGAVVLVNEPARELLGLPDVRAGTAVAELGAFGLDPALVELLASGRPADAERFAAGGRILVVSQTDALAPIREGVTSVREGVTSDREGVTSDRLGWVATFVDRTELARTSGELEQLRTLTHALRARSHEADNRLHTMAALVELGRAQEALEFASSTVRSTQELADRVVEAVSDATLAALVLGKAAQAAERGVHLEVTELDVPPGLIPAADLVTIVGNLLDNAVDAAASAPPPRSVRLEGELDGADLVLRVWDSGPGVPRELRDRIFERGVSTKSADAPHGRGIGLALVAEAVRARAGTIVFANDDNGTRFEARLPVLGGWVDAERSGTEGEA